MLARGGSNVHRLRNNALVELINARKRDDLGSRGAFGLMLLVAFSLRFVIEFFKENQEAFELGLPINMGQLLSLPLIILGAAFFFLSFKKGRVR